MKKGRFFNHIILILCTVIVGSLFVGCNQEEVNDSSNNGGYSGSILALGSSALQPLAQEAASKFMEKYSDTDIQVQGGGSGKGLSAASDGSAQIGNSDIFADEKDGIDAKALEDHKVAVVGFAAVVNPKVNVDNLTKQQLIDIFTGKITNWKDVGGSDVDIVLINRPSSSGTRATFKKYALDGNEESTGKALTEDNSGTVLKTVADTEGSISYLALSYLKSDSIKALKIDGVEPTSDNIINGKYSIWSYEHMYTKGPAQGLVKAFIEYMLSDEIKPSVQKLGYIPVSDMKVSR